MGASIGFSVTLGACARVFHKVTARITAKVSPKVTTEVSQVEILILVRIREQI